MTEQQPLKWRHFEAEIITVDINAAYPKAIAERKASGILSDAVAFRQVK